MLMPGLGKTAGGTMIGAGVSNMTPGAVGIGGTGTVSPAGCAWSCTERTSHAASAKGNLPSVMRNSPAFQGRIQITNGGRIADSLKTTKPVGTLP
ncbi:MAG: hypothetical protein ACPH5G_10790 [Pseudooceanicola atlanticus]